MLPISSVNSGRSVLTAILCTALLFLSGCASAPSAPLDPADLVLSAGSRILAAEAEKNLFEYRLKPLSRRLAAPDPILIVSVEDPLSGGDLQQLVARALADTPSATVVLLLARRSIEKQYNPYRVFRGWRTESVVDGYVNGRPVTRKKDVPRFDTEYRHRCVRIRYRILQYGPDAAPLGRSDPEPPSLQQCPEDSKADVTIDEFDAAARWLAERIRVAGPPKEENRK